MAQSALTVTVANPTPPTNFANCVGNTPPLDPAQAAIDDGAAGSLVVIAAKVAAANTAGAPGAGISNDAEGKGSETTVTSTVPNPSPVGQFVSFSDMGSYTGLVTPTSGGVATQSPNNQHASSLSAAGTSTISSLTPSSTASGSGTISLTVTGTNFRRDSIVSVNGVPQITNYASATSLIVTNAPKKATSGTLPVTVTTGGITTAATNWTFT